MAKDPKGQDSGEDAANQFDVLDFMEQMRERDRWSEFDPAYEKSWVPAVAARVLSRKVFVVHGHDEGAREAVARLLEKLLFQPIILHERANQGRTIIEKLEANTDVGFAVILLTPDDVGGKAGTSTTPRARQNVLLEWGYFIGRLGRNRVSALRKGDVELPSDIHGIIWEAFDENGAWKGKLAKELEAAGFVIDWAKVHS